MKQQLEKRLQQLKQEFAAGQELLTELEAKQANTKETLLRIAGGIQVLEEELAKSNESNGKVEEVIEQEAEIVT